MNKDIMADVLKRAGNTVDGTNKKRWRNAWKMWGDYFPGFIIFYMNGGHCFSSYKKDIEQISADIICIFDRTLNYKVFLSTEDIVSVAAKHAHPDVAEED